MRYLFPIILYTLLSFQSFAQKGTLKGTVKDKDTSEEIIGANVVIEGTTTGTSTDIFGDFEFQSDPGIVDVVVTYIGYETFRIENLEISAGEEVSLSIQMQTDNLQLEEIVVEAKADLSNENILLIDRKESLGLTQAIGAQELSRVLAGSAAEGLKKVVGLSVQGSKFVVVRGLGDRYNNSTLNGFPIASPNPDKRIIPYDIFPDDVIGNIGITKAFTPDIYGDFSGASINIQTKEYPDEQTFVIELSSQINTQSTFKDFLFDKAHEEDILGYNQTRRLAEEIHKSDQEGNRNFDSRDYGPYNEDNWFTTKFDPDVKKAPVNKGASLIYGNFFPIYKINQHAGIGVMINANYNDGTELQTGKIRMLQNNQGSFRQDFDANRYISYTNTSGAGNLTFKFNNLNKISFNSLYTHITDNNVLVTDGYFWDFDPNVLSRRTTFRDYELFVMQLNGEHSLINGRLDVVWGYSSSDATHTEPDRRQVSMRYNPELPENERTYLISSQDRAETHRLFIGMDDKDDAARLSGKVAIIPAQESGGDLDILAFTAGVNYRNKVRNYRLRQFNHALSPSKPLNPENTDAFLSIDSLNSGAYYINEGSQISDEYSAELNILSPYFNIQWQIIPRKLNINLGIRYEMAKQYIEYAINDDQLNGLVPLTRNAISTDDIFPSVLARYNFTESLILRASYSRTVSRPDFRETSPVEYRESFGAFRNVGNPELQNGYNDNYDLRFEKYDEDGGLFSIGAFAKQLDNPIVQNVEAGSNPRMSYQNGQQATVIGIELETRKNLGFISPVFKPLTFNGNVSLLKSEITIDSVQSGSTNQTSNVRKLEGASPYLVNADLTYTKFLDKMDYSITVAYNVFGRRLAGIGFLGIGDIYELPYNTLNITTNVNFGTDAKWGFKASAGNLLNPTIRTEQDLLNEEGIPREQVELNSYKTGITFGLSIYYRVL
jgi:outer membrane receptor protein involved in Fe transport